MKALRGHRTGGGKRGSALVFSLVVVVGMGAMSLSLLAINMSVEKAQRQQQRSLSSFYAAEAGLSAAYLDLVNGGDGSLGSEDAPVELGGSTYFVTVADLGSGMTSLVSTGDSNNQRSRHELVVEQLSTGLFQYAAFGDDGVLLNSNAFTDSYDSSAGSYVSQVSGDHANEEGGLGSNADITIDSNTDVYGSATPGPTGIFDDSASNTYISGATTPRANLMALPPITLPTTALSGDYDAGASDVLTTGEYHFGDLEIKANRSLTLEGPATLLVENFTLRSNGDFIVDTTAGAVEIYVTGSFDLRSNGDVITNSDSALDLSLFLTTDNHGVGDTGDTIAFNSNADFTGTVYAPDAYVTIDSNFEIYGGIIADFVELSSFTSIHYDETLEDGGSTSTSSFSRVLWRPTSIQ